jgi:UDP-N-acetylmuramoyl-L-alanyl-D-glutamate--2,6-diaminopimelate ligase
MPTSLKKLFTDFPFEFSPRELPDLSITDITGDSRAVKPGSLFVAMTGGSADGHRFISDAIARGAVAVVGEQDVAQITNLRLDEQLSNLFYIKVDNSRLALAHLAAAYYDWPARKLTMIGVTGTDGKTTTTNLLHQILLTAGLKAGMVSTVNAVIGDEVLDTGFHVTTPDAPDVQRYLARMVEAGLTHVVLETTSHGWAQFRVDACEFDIGAVTNITHEHLDYHGSYENYRAAKARLFTGLAETKPKRTGNPRLAVLNRDDASYEYLSATVRGLPSIVQLCYGLNSNADIHAEQIEYSPSGIHFVVAGKDFRVNVTTKLVGAYNVSNCLAAFSVAVAGLGIDPEVAARGIAALDGVPGRMERIDLGQPFTAIVDFAHTPNALKVSLEAAREMLEGKKDERGKKGRVIAVFGSAGLRDKEKRRMMAEVSAELADLTVLTAEDPRTESLEGILVEMAAGARSRGGSEGETFWRVADRGEAIRFAVKLARPGDIVLSCGKGHEQSMCFGKTEFLWDDRTAMRAALSELMGVDGPPMPYLPSQDKLEEEWLKG